MDSSWGTMGAGGALRSCQPGARCESGVKARSLPGSAPSQGKVSLQSCEHGSPASTAKRTQQVGSDPMGPALQPPASCLPPQASAPSPCPSTHWSPFSHSSAGLSSLTFPLGGSTISSVWLSSLMDPSVHLLTCLSVLRVPQPPLLCRNSLEAAPSPSQAPGRPPQCDWPMLGWMDGRNAQKAQSSPGRSSRPGVGGRPGPGCKPHI